MSLDRWFRLSSSLTLGLSCGALVFAEVPFLPDLPICLPPVLALLVLAWWVEGRWRLPNWGANILGLFIAAGGIIWLVGQLGDEESLLVRLPLQLALLPYMGPLLMAALLVKVFGGSSESGDFWRLQGLGLMQISLGCVLDGGPIFGALLFAYLASGLACLALRYRLSSAQRPRGMSSFGESASPCGASAASSLSATWLVSFTLRWTLLIAVPALLLFLLTPRRDNNAWEPLGSLRSGSSRARLQGGSDEINLNTTGRVEMDDEIALEVRAVDADGQPKLDLPGEQRWRGVVLDSYEHGKWTPLHPMPNRQRRLGQDGLPDFGPQQYFLSFAVWPRRSGGLVLAEPLRFGSEPLRLPVRTESADGRPRLFAEIMGTLLPLHVRDQREVRYRQVVPVGEDGDRMPAYGLRSGRIPPRLIIPPPPLAHTLHSWTVDLLHRLAQDSRYRLPPGLRHTLAQPSSSFLVEPEDWEATARVLTDYLARSGEFTYTLELTRIDATLDPVVDFLLNVRQGHCERYASALTLMLRSLSIPARVVKGFRGCESQGDGLYVVRHRHAHAWVEVLVPRPDAREKAPPPLAEPVYDWVSLDPTPVGEAAPSASFFSFSRLWLDIQRMARQGWQTLIVDYNADEQADLWDTLRSGHHLARLRKLGFVVAALLIIFCAGLVLRRGWRRRRSAASPAASDTAAFYPRLVRILSRYVALRPSVGETPREYGEAARSFLQTHPALNALAGLPLRVVDLFYRVRFGDRPLNEEERQALDGELNRLAEAVRQEGG